MGGGFLLLDGCEVRPCNCDCKPLDMKGSGLTREEEDVWRDADGRVDCRWTSVGGLGGGVGRSMSSSRETMFLLPLLALDLGGTLPLLDGPACAL